MVLLCLLSQPLAVPHVGHLPFATFSGEVRGNSVAPQDELLLLLMEALGVQQLPLMPCLGWPHSLPLSRRG